MTLDTDKVRVIGGDLLFASLKKLLFEGVLCLRSFSRIACVICIGGV